MNILKTKYGTAWLLAIPSLFCVIYIASYLRTDILKEFSAGNYVIESDCRFYNSSLDVISQFPGRFCKYDNERGLVLLGRDTEVCLMKASGEVLWCNKTSQTNHDLFIDSKRQMYYILDYELSRVSGESEGFSVIKGFNQEGIETFSWSSVELYADLLASKYRELLISNYVRREVAISDPPRRLTILINNIQLLEDTPLERPEWSESGRYLLLSFSNLNHLAVFDLKEKKILQRFDLFEKGGGGYFHTPQLLSSNEVLIFRNFNEKNQPLKLPLIGTPKESFFSDACVVELENFGHPVKCWLDDLDIQATIMGSAQLIEGNLFASYCSEHGGLLGCVMNLLDSKGRSIWSSRQVEHEFGIDFVLNEHIYRAHLVGRRERSKFLNFKSR